MVERGIYSPLIGTALYRVHSKNRLAKILFTSVTNLKKLVKTDDPYNCWTENKSNGGTRNIAAPHENLKIVQKRISDLLQRIEAPDYLMAPVKKRSYVTNAAAHIGASSFRLLDIEDFFPSCTEKRVFWFFNKCMDCSTDVSAILAAITTREGALPQGSPCSPILAFFSYIDMWEEIDALTQGAGYKLTVYADDITISGKIVYEKDIWQIKQILLKNGHFYSQEKERSIRDKPAKITGVVVTGTAILLPNQQHLKLRNTRIKLSEARSKKSRNSIELQLRGRISQANQISKHLQTPTN